MDWSIAFQHLEDLVNVYKELPAESAWFVLNLLRTLRERYEKGERTEQFYKEIMAMEL